MSLFLVFNAMLFDTILKWHFQWLIFQKVACGSESSSKCNCVGYSVGDYVGFIVGEDVGYVVSHFVGHFIGHFVRLFVVFYSIKTKYKLNFIHSIFNIQFQFTTHF